MTTDDAAAPRTAAGDREAPRAAEGDREAPRIPRWDHLRTTEVADAAARDPVVVLPLGAIEQHGPHLPLSTDLEIAEGLLARAARHLPADLPAWTLPAIAVGASREHARFPGTLSLEPEVLAEVVESIGRGLADAGVRRLVLHSGHGGNRHVMDAAALRLRHEEGMLVVKVHYPRLGRPSDLDLPEGEWRHGLHGGAVETAMMLHLQPEAVRMEVAPDAVRDDPPLGEEMEEDFELLGPEGPAPFAWVAGDLHPSGIAGRPGLATPEMGEALVDHWSRALARVIEEAKAFPLKRLVR